PTRDVAHGEGQILPVADRTAVLEVYPQAQVARVTTAHARVEVYRTPGYSVNPSLGLVVFEQGTDEQRTRLLINREGRVSFHPVLRPIGAASPDQTTDTAPVCPANGAQRPSTRYRTSGRDPSRRFGVRGSASDHLDWTTRSRPGLHSNG